MVPNLQIFGQTQKIVIPLVVQNIGRTSFQVSKSSYKLDNVICHVLIKTSLTDMICNVLVNLSLSMLIIDVCWIVGVGKPSVQPTVK